MNKEVFKLYEQGEIGTAILIAKQALQLAQEIFPSPNNDLATSLNNLAALYRDLGRWADAEPLYDEALAIGRHLFGDLPNNDLAASLNNSAALYYSQGRWADAEPLYDEALSICRYLFGDRPNNDLAASLNNLAGLYRDRGRWADAEPIFDEALSIRRHLFGDLPNNNLAASLNNLASLYHFRGRWVEAEPLYDEAVKIRRELFGTKANNDLATSLDNLASLYHLQRRWAEAESLYDEAVKIRRELFGTKANNDLATSLNNLASLYHLQRRWAEAESLYDEAVKIRRELFGETGHPDLVMTLINLALAYAQQQQSSLALPLFQEAIASENKWLTNILATNDAEQRMEDLKQRETNLEYLLSLTQQDFLNDPQVVATTFNAILSRKALAATAEATFSKALRDRPELSPQIERYKTYQQEIANLSHVIGSQPELKDRLNTLLRQKGNLEKKLARSIPAINLAQQVIDRQALTELLPADAFLVEFVRYRDGNFVDRDWQPARYLAFIIRHDREGVSAIDCGLAQPLDVAIDKFRRAHSDIDFSGQNSGLCDGLWNPASESVISQPNLLDFLLPHFPTTGTCYIAPDSKLHILPFHLLKTDDGEYLGDRYHLHYLTTARDLYRRNFPISANPPIILADPDYNGGTIPTVAVSPKTGMQSSHDVNGAAFEPLPINRTLGDRVAARYGVPCYSDLEATVDRLERLNAPQVLAIATHGFSLSSLQDFIDALTESKPDEEERILRDRQTEITKEFRDYWQARADAGNEWSQQLLVKIDNIGIYKSTDLLATPISDPMLRSGIALAGANIWRFQGTPDPKFGKGVAFAHDIAQWDLWGTELAVMITCVSGMGEVRDSEGVFGLRRALAIAGAKYTISSLWNIKTKPSVLLMDKFFELYQSEARPTPPAALAAAQSYVRNITLGELRASDIGKEIVAELQSDRRRDIRDNAPDDLKPLSHPHFWGAWICQG